MAGDTVRAVDAEQGGSVVFRPLQNASLPPTAVVRAGRGQATEWHSRQLRHRQDIQPRLLADDALSVRRTVLNQ